MAIEIKAGEIVPPTEIRPLNGLEIDSVEGGIYVPPFSGGCFPRRPDPELPVR